MVYAVWKLWLAPTIIAGISESDIQYLQIDIWHSQNL